MGNKITSLPEDDTTSLENLCFYQNKIKSHPDGDFIDNIHKEWFGDYTLLEARHSFIQWIFPIRESGMNWSSQPLTKYEASILRNSPEAKSRLIRSLEMMLDFYGMYLDPSTRLIFRSADEQHVNAQYKLLNTSFHNYLRITRILKCLGIFSCEDLKFRLLNHMVLEIFKYRRITQAAKSCIEYWIPTLRRRSDILRLDALITKYAGIEVDRDNKYGWGDESEETWSNKFFPDFLDGHYDENTEFEVLEDVFTAEVDPYKQMRDRFKNSESHFAIRSYGSSQSMKYTFSSDDEEDDDDYDSEGYTSYDNEDASSRGLDIQLEDYDEDSIDENDEDDTESGLYETCESIQKGESDKLCAECEAVITNQDDGMEISWTGRHVDEKSEVSILMK